MAPPLCRRKTTIVASAQQLLEAKLATISLMYWSVGLVGVSVVFIYRSSYAEKGQKLEDVKTWIILKADLLHN